MASGTLPPAMSSGGCDMGGRAPAGAAALLLFLAFLLLRRRA
jgi:MYXO-CTERM domain-containing protein